MQIDQLIKMIMYGDAGKKVSPLVLILSLVSRIYEMIVRFRYALYSRGILKTKKLPCVVISIGNLTVGGTGKTPMTIYIAKLLDHLGYTVAVISRGYKGNAEKTGGILCDGKTLLMGADDAGDEPLMMAIQLKHIPVLIGARRYEMGLMAKQTFNSDIIILDDAFQHIQLKRDIDLVLLDSRHPFGNTCMMPRGILREPVSGLIRGDAFVITRYHEPSERSVDSVDLLKSFMIENNVDKPVFKTFHTPYFFTVDKNTPWIIGKTVFPRLSYDFTFLKHRNVLAFSGIAGNHHFAHTIEEMSCNISEHLEYPDHYQYTAKELMRIVAKAQEQNVEYILTTEKDFMRMHSVLPWPVDLVVMGVEITIEDEEEFQQFIKTRLEVIKKN